MKDQTLMDHLSKLAKLSFEGEAKEQMENDLESIMTLMDTIREVQISEADYPLKAEGGMELLREDTIQPSLSPDEVVAGAKSKLYHFIAVQKLMD